MGQLTALTTEQMSNLYTRLPGVIRTAQGKITLCNYLRKYLSKTHARLCHAIKEEKQERRQRVRARVIILSIPTVVKMLGGEAMRQSKKAALMHPANLVTWKIKQGGTLSL